MFVIQNHTFMYVCNTLYKISSYCLESRIRKLVIFNVRDDKYLSSRPGRGLTYLYVRYTSTSD